LLIKVTDITDNAYDVCIIGAGAAGIVTAIELCRSDLAIRVLLLEHGPKDGHAPTNNPLDNSIQLDNLLNHHPPEECTNKGIGGTTATWGGRCVLFDEVDFIPRKIIGDECTWSVKLFEELKSFVSRTQTYFESGVHPFELPDDAKPIAEGFHSDDVSDRILERWSRPTRFGKRYRETLMSLQNLHIVCGVTADRLEIDEDRKDSKVLLVKTGEIGREARIQANVFVIACGAQESTRLLFRSPQLFRSLGEFPTALGKFYQGHVSGKIASIQFNGDPKKTDFGFHQESDGTYVRRRFQLTKDCILRENLLNTALWLDNPLYFDPSHRSGAMSFMYLAMITPVLGRKLAPPAIAYSITKGRIHKVGAHLRNVFLGLPKSLVVPANIFLKRYFVSRKLPGVFLYSPKNEYALHYHAEQLPCESNRIELAEDGETLQIRYRITDGDADSIVRTHEILDKALQDSGSGRLRYWYSKDVLHEKVKEISRDGLHQNGTTRIADGPDRGVVDSNLRLFGTKNVYICSSSAFPTSGQANPTFLLGMFAVRLVDHLREVVLEKR
jgi:choline dehydrogenase-like flavoprotein